MPVATTLTVPVTEVKKNDIVNEGVVTKVRTLDVNVELTLATGKVQRVRKDNVMNITRNVPTREEKRANIVEQRDLSVAAIKSNAAAWVAKGDSAIRAELADCKNLRYTLEWNVEDWLKQLHMLDLFGYLHDWFEKGTIGDRPATDLEIVLAFLKQNERNMLQWTPTRSTSPVHSMSGTAEFLARREIVDGLGRYEFAAVTWAVKRLAEFDAGEVDA